ncbi:MAG: exodeoxyribonuclease VII large subunit [Lachnospiraceae bacterium]|nr:exodeoxyribonuclease VII large subunit [Candidatus Colinaster scatohippi]
MAGSVYTVAQINSYIKNMFTHDYLLAAVAVKGEISNYKYHSSGHIYFTLKDKQSVISCVMFAGNRRGLSFSLQEGMQVIVYGRVDTYERDGKYQLYAVRIEQDGLGELYEKYLKLKEELEERGLFAQEYKKPIPKDCRVLGVVTAPNGAAIRDIISVAKARDPYVQIILYPANVQGANAAPSIVRGIRMLEEYGVDTMIVGRGGGSIEDLWAFNEEIVAQAIFDCGIPIISAVGHETDFTIADFVADVRVETPTAAAALATRDVAGIEQAIGVYRQQLVKEMNRKTEKYRLTVGRCAARLTGLSPKSKIADRRFFTMQSEDRLKDAMQRKLDGRRNRLALAAEALNGVSPLLKLSQGYSFSETKDGRCINDAAMVKPGEDITVYVKNGHIDATVNSIEVTRN